MEQQPVVSLIVKPEFIPDTQVEFEAMVEGFHYVLSNAIQPANPLDN